MNPADGSYSLDFQLNDGLGLGTGMNTATIGDFQFFGGNPSLLGSAFTSEGAFGDLNTGVAVSDTDPTVNEFFQEFSPGAWLSFNVILTSSASVAKIAM